MCRQSETERERERERARNDSRTLFLYLLGTHVQFKVHSGIASRSGVSLGLILGDRL